MKKYTAWIFSLALGVFLLGMATSCVDKIAFGNSFLEKASGSDVTKDTVFSSAEYTEQFLNFCYSLQYYGMPYRNTSSDDIPIETSNNYVGKWECLTDIMVYTYGSAGIAAYLNGTHSANYGQRSDKFDYTRNGVWEAIRACWLLIENVDDVPDLDDDRKEEMKAEAKCILAARFFDMFRHYGGIPIVKASFSGNDSSYDYPRGSIEECVEFMVDLFDEAAEVLPWNVETPATESGRWNRAAAMAYKCRVLQFAASPIFNDTEPYHPDVSAGDDVADAVWYGNYSSSRWTDLLEACEDFFDELDANGEFYLQEADGTRPEDYRLAYRIGYWKTYSPEILVNLKIFGKDAFNSSNYAWHNWNAYIKSNGSLTNRPYVPTNNYMEMFCWSDGTKFDWDNDFNWAYDSNGYYVKGTDDTKRDPAEMFLTGNIDDDDIVLTRDPRLYEEIVVNYLPYSLDFTTGNMSGIMTEAWVGGYDAGTGPSTQTGRFSTGYCFQKFIMGGDVLRDYTQWPLMRLSEMYLIYAEALLQTGSLSKAIEQIDIVRARVGMGGLAEMNPDLNLTSDADALLEELLRERACELGMEDARYFDLVRYKRADLFETQPYGMRMHRIVDGEATDSNTAWYGNSSSVGYNYVDRPTEFAYEKYLVTGPLVRYWWTNGFDEKWYLSPFPATEVNLEYGLIQNPGW